ncbi:MAG: hypothetical protein ACREC5_07335, partial [Thermoplasmata archaeon]
LGLELLGSLPPSPRLLEQSLRESLARERREPAPIRLVRLEGRRAIVQVPHLATPAARRAWNGPGGVDPSGGGFSVRTCRTYGTLLKAKAWIRSTPK